MSFLTSKFTRRSFTQTVVGSTALLILPKSLPAKAPSPAYWFMNNQNGVAWSVDDPVLWALENARKPILRRAAERLQTLSSADDQRIIRLVTRRCQLNLLELRPGQTVVHHWAPQGLADLRPFFKRHHLTRPDIEVVVRDRRREVTQVQPGDDFLYGDRLGQNWPLEIYVHKWQRRNENERDDTTAAPVRWSGCAWAGLEPNHIPWAVLKSLWQRTPEIHCLNCGQPTILASFSHKVTGMYQIRIMLHHVCGTCRRSFPHEAKEISNSYPMTKYLLANLDVSLQPDLIRCRDGSDYRFPLLALSIASSSRT